jgi:signal transduction histidine kinase
VRRFTKLWSAAVAACLAVLILAALFLPKSFFLTALSDIIQCLLLFSGVASFIYVAIRSRGRLRLFWTLLAAGISLWFSYQLFWTYHEIWLRTDVPDLCAADIILFLHIVPLMGALAVRPHARQDEYAARFRRLDFALLIVWWMYLYILIVIPWQYVMPMVEAYGNNLNSLYLIEKIAFLTAVFAAWLKSKGGWKIFYANLFGASLTYAASSHVANWALSRHSYYSGSLYDIPLAVSMAWITVIGLWPPEIEPQAAMRSTSTSHGVWLARAGMIAAFSLPLFAAWDLVDGPIPPRVRWFRLVLTLAAALLMGGMVFVRQYLLDRELLRLLKHSQESISNLKHLQAQITESEKLASIGQLVGGAAHELNNPITAMLGYSDLLVSTKLNSGQTELAEKIGLHVRRTRSLVASLLSFARQGPVTMVPVDLNGLLRTAIKLSQPQWQKHEIEVRTQLTNGLLLVRGDSNQLLQVWAQIINDALHALELSGGRTLSVASQQLDTVAIIDMAGNVPEEEKTPEGISLESASAENSAGLGLTACQGIVRQHHGRIQWQNGAKTGFSVRVELPAIPATEKSNEVGLPALTQSQRSS